MAISSLIHHQTPHFHSAFLLTLKTSPLLLFISIFFFFLVDEALCQTNGPTPLLVVESTVVNTRRSIMKDVECTSSMVGQELDRNVWRTWVEDNPQSDALGKGNQMHCAPYTNEDGDTEYAIRGGDLVGGLNFNAQQSYDVSSVANEIDQGWISLIFSARVWGEALDRIQLRLMYYDNTQADDFSSPLHGHPSKYFYSEPPHGFQKYTGTRYECVPAKTRRIVLTINCVKVAGDACDGFVDELSLHLFDGSEYSRYVRDTMLSFRKTPNQIFGSNLIFDPYVELDMEKVGCVGWQSFAGPAVLKLDQRDFPVVNISKGEWGQTLLVESAPDAPSINRHWTGGPSKSYKPDIRYSYSSVSQLLSLDTMPHYFFDSNMSMYSTPSTTQPQQPTESAANEVDDNRLLLKELVLLGLASLHGSLYTSSQQSFHKDYSNLWFLFYRGRNDYNRMDDAIQRSRVTEGVTTTYTWHRKDGCALIPKETQAIQAELRFYLIQGVWNGARSDNISVAVFPHLVFKNPDNITSPITGKSLLENRHVHIDIADRGLPFWQLMHTNCQKSSGVSGGLDAPDTIFFAENVHLENFTLQITNGGAKEFSSTSTFHDSASRKGGRSKSDQLAGITIRNCTLRNVTIIVHDTPVAHIVVADSTFLPTAREGLSSINLCVRGANIGALNLENNIGSGAYGINVDARHHYTIIDQLLVDESNDNSSHDTSSGTLQVTVSKATNSIDRLDADVADHALDPTRTFGNLLLRVGSNFTFAVQVIAELAEGKNEEPMHASNYSTPSTATHLQVLASTAEITAKDGGHLPHIQRLFFSASAVGANIETGVHHNGTHFQIPNGGYQFTLVARKMTFKNMSFVAARNNDRTILHVGSHPLFQSGFASDVSVGSSLVFDSCTFPVNTVLQFVNISKSHSHSTPREERALQIRQARFFNYQFSGCAFSSAAEGEDDNTTSSMIVFSQVQTSGITFTDCALPSVWLLSSVVVGTGFVMARENTVLDGAALRLVATEVMGFGFHFLTAAHNFTLSLEDNSAVVADNVVIDARYSPFSATSTAKTRRYHVDTTSSIVATKTTTFYGDGNRAVVSIKASDENRIFEEPEYALLVSIMLANEKAQSVVTSERIILSSFRIPGTLSIWNLGKGNANERPRLTLSDCQFLPGSTFVMLRSDFGSLTFTGQTAILPSLLSIQHNSLEQPHLHALDITGGETAQMSLNMPHICVKDVNMGQAGKPFYMKQWLRNAVLVFGNIVANVKQQEEHFAFNSNVTVVLEKGIHVHHSETFSVSVQDHPSCILYHEDGGTFSSKLREKLTIASPRWPPPDATRAGCNRPDLTDDDVHSALYKKLTMYLNAAPDQVWQDAAQQATTNRCGVLLSSPNCPKMNIIGSETSAMHFSNGSVGDCKVSVGGGVWAPTPPTDDKRNTPTNSVSATASPSRTTSLEPLRTPSATQSFSPPGRVHSRTTSPTVLADTSTLQPTEAPPATDAPTETPEPTNVTTLSPDPTTAPPPPPPPRSEVGGENAVALQVIVNKDTAEAVAASSTATAVVVGSISPTTGAQVAKLGASLRSIQCDIGDLEEVPSFLEHPMHPPIGNGPLRYHAGGALCSCLMITAVSIASTVMFLRNIPSSSSSGSGSTSHSSTTTSSSGTSSDEEMEELMSNNDTRTTSSSRSSTKSGKNKKKKTKLFKTTEKPPMASLHTGLGVVSAVINAYFIPSVVGTGVACAVHGDDGTVQFIGAVSSLVAVGLTVNILFWLSKNKFAAVGMRTDRMKSQEQYSIDKKKDKLFFVNAFQTSFSSQSGIAINGAKKSKIIPRFFVETFEPYFDACRVETSFWCRVYYVEDILAAGLMAAIAQIRPGGDCRGIAASVTFVSVIHAMYLVLVKPYARFLDTFFTGLAAFINLVLGFACIVAAWKIEQGEDDSETMEQAEYVMATAVMFQSVLFFIQAAVQGYWYVHVTWRRRRLMREEEEEEATLQEESSSSNEDEGDHLDEHTALAVPFLGQEENASSDEDENDDAHRNPLAADRH